MGQTLTANLNGTWGPAPVTLEYRWTADAVAIPGASASTFTLTSAQLGKKIIIKIIGTKVGYTTTSRQSPYSVAVAP